MKKSLLAVLLCIIFSAGVKGQACVGSESLTATPPPANGTYYPGTVVTFCYSVTDYAQTSADWLCGAVPTLGSGWDLSTLQPVSSPASCDGQGVWGWYTSCTSTASGQTFGPGFYYDSPAGSASGTLDGIPGNNFGDNCMNNTWTFCFSIMVANNAPNGASLNVTMTSYSDYDVGSWGSQACVDPPNNDNTIFATVANCVLIVPTVTITNATCASSFDGSITVVPNGVAPYTFLWNTGATTSTISNLAPGIYTVTVSDSTTCAKVVTIPVGGPPPILSNAVVVNNGCTQTGGSISLYPSGGNGSVFTFLWNDGSTGSSLNNLNAGTYIVTITDSTLCTETDTFNVTSVAPLVASTFTTPAGCNGALGSASVLISSGTSPYTFLWSPIGGTNAIASNLPAGIYTVDITDASGCMISLTDTVQAIGTFTLSTTFIPLSCDPLQTTSATVTVTGGASPFTYNWTPTGGNQATATGLSAGTYVVYVTDANGCLDSSTVVIPPAMPVSVTPGSTPVMCNQPNSGIATVTATGGTGSYTYLWSDGSTSSSLNNVAGGNYTVTVTDSQGCSASTTVTVNVIPDVQVTAGPDQSICSGQPATITGTASNGTAPFTYTWNPSASGNPITVNPTVTTTYTVTVTDANNCTATATTLITVDDYPVIVISDDETICDGDQTTLTASGGDTYSWSPSADLNDPASSSPVASPSVSTTYTVTVSNGGCSASATVDINVLPGVDASFTPDSVSGQAPLTVNFDNNTNGADTYSWDFGDGNTSTASDPSNTYSNLGSYTVTLVASNSNGCTDTARFLYIEVDELSSLTVPNIFTPNGDGKNDVFKLEEVGISKIDVRIFNRWGNEVYSWANTNGSWNGKSKDGEILPDGVYLYVIVATGVNAKNFKYQGTVQMISYKN